MIDVQEVTVRVGNRTLIESVSLHAKPGEVTALIGPNGAGKSTLLAAIAGDLAFAGEISIAGLSAAAPASELARTRAVMLQDVNVSFEYLVQDVVEMGRRPWCGTEKKIADAQIVAAAMQAADVVHLAGREVATLSGGERARVAFARILAQTTPVILLDEPTAALDIRHQQQLLGLARSLARDAGATVVIVLHDLNAAAAYCDHIVCLANGAVVASGSVEEVLQTETLSAVYGWPISVQGRTVLPASADLRIEEVFAQQIGRVHV